MVTTRETGYEQRVVTRYSFGLFNTKPARTMYEAIEGRGRGGRVGRRKKEEEGGIERKCFLGGGEGGVEGGGRGRG